MASNWRDGDWKCHNCGHHCFKKKKECPLCLTVRSGSGSAAAGSAPVHGHSSKASHQHHANHKTNGHAHGHHGAGVAHSSYGSSSVPSGHGHGHSHSSSTSAPGRRFLDKMLKNPDARIDDEDSAALFLAAIVAYEDAEELMARLTSVRENGQRALIQALTNHDAFADREFLSAHVQPVLKWLGSDVFSRGASKRSLDALLSEIVQQEQWLKAMARLAQRGELDVSACSCIGWLLLQAVSAAEDLGARARHPKLRPLIMAIVDAMHERRREEGHDGVRRLTQQIRVVLNVPDFAAASAAASALAAAAASAAGKQLLTLAAVNYLPGGRHDNDKEQYRDIALLPTRAEMAFTGDEYLPKPENVIDEATCLDRWFRLLRYDFVRQIKDEVAELQKAKPANGAGASSAPAASAAAIDRSRRLYNNCHVLDFFSGFDPNAVEGKDGKKPSSMILRGFFYVNFAHDSQRPLRRSPHWWESHSRELDRDSLVCVLVDRQPVCFAQVCKREPRELASSEPRFGIVPCSRSAGEELLALMLRKRSFQILQCDASFFSVQPVLLGLQRMTRIPFATELVHFNKQGDQVWGPDLNTLHPRYAELVKRLLKGEKAAQLIKSNKLQHGLDESQEKAVLHGLQYRTAFIQGPPGTGKSFVGALLAKAIFDTTNETILCVCFTNHALDQFLLDLLAHGIEKKNLVRVGGSKRIHPDLEEVKLYRLADLESDPQGTRKEIAIACKSIETVQFELEKLANRRRPNLLFHLRANHPKWAARFFVEPSQDGMQTVGKKKKNKAIDMWTLLDAWRAGDSAKGLVLQLLERNGHAADPASLECWQMSKQKRREQIDEWEADMDAELVREYDRLIAELHREQQKRTDLMLMRKKIALEGRRIIGCTTTGAAKNYALLRHVQAGVLIVEEAGEILEPHILTAMSDSIKSVIQIGDHKQLRPKTECHELSVGHRNGFDLNRSMFERMVLKGFHHQTLNVQHRMHEHIATMVRQLTYPLLQTAATVTDATHPSLRGVQGRGRVLFVNHDAQEGAHGLLMQRDDGASAHSKVNEHEAQMVVRTARYLLQQGYRAEQLVLLTPYLGQVALLRDALEQLKLDATINSMDEKDMIQAEAAAAGDDAKPHKSGSASAAAAGQPPIHRPAIKIATIDNYQGEEADVVIVSLVRCNAHHGIGFTGKPERVNVLLSRARHGLILFGSARTLCDQRPGNDEWKKVLALPLGGAADVLVPGGAVVAVKAVEFYEGLPIVCARHPSELHLLSTPADFDQLAPGGGCARECGAAMGCGQHSCPRKCHSNSKLMGASVDDHAASQCQVQLPYRCQANKHDLSRACGQPVPPCPECRREREKLQRAAEQERVRVFQLQQELAAQEATLQITLQAEQVAAERRLHEQLLQLKKEQSAEILATLKAEMERQQAAELKKQAEDHHLHIAQLKQQLAANQAKVAANPMSKAGASSSSSSSASVSSVPSKVTKKLFESIAAGSPEFNQVAHDFNDSFAHMPQYANLHIAVTGVQAIHNHALAQAFAAAKAARAKAKADVTESTVYHGTHPDNISKIALNNISMKHKGKLDPGWFGAGLYFSKFADYTLMYNCTGHPDGIRPVQAGDRGRLLRFTVLPGRVHQLSGMAYGHAQTAGFDSHLTPNQYELVLFDSNFALPTHVLDFSVTAAAGAHFDSSVEKHGGKNK